MFTANFYKMLGAAFYGNSSYGVNCTQYSGDSNRYIQSNYLKDYLPILSQGGISLRKGPNNGEMNGVYFGDGDAAPSLGDYNIAGNAFSTYDGTYSVSFDADALEWTMTYTLTNTGSSDFTVKEIGLFCYYCLVDRTLLDNPVTIPAGGVGQIVYKIKTNMPA